MILAIDGGNSKTDVALVAMDGALVGHARGPLSSPHHLGLDASVDLLADLVAEAGLDGRQADVAQVLLAGVDFPIEEQQLRDALAPRAWAQRLNVGNDTYAVLRAGTDRGYGIGVVCGAGINCLGVAPDGRQVRFPALGVITGDWGGGYDVGLAAISAAARSDDGRGPRTALEQLVPAYFGLASPLELAWEIHTGRIAQRRAVELAPVVFAAAPDDPVADGIVVHLGEEIVALVRATAARLALDGPLDVVLGGGLMRGASDRLLGVIRDGLANLDLALLRTSAPPIVGAVLLALDELGASDVARARARRELEAAF